MKTIAVIGWKNSGKTTLVSRLVAHLRKKKFKVGVVKHAHHSFDIDHPNTDSYKIREAGSYKTTIVSEKRLAHIEEKISPEIDIEELIKLNEGCDILIFEGFKKIKKLSKIEVNLKKNNKELLYKSFDNVKLLVSDDMSEHPIKVLSHDQVNEITKEILSDSF
ncbi:MAG: molybdopterin-guanine dinucleotide biosynthesis protein B [Alphaproteobacteria bacterium]|jgi:molybdopterin-guanine dinucleotide biosynthesis protein B